jgi:predicted Zn finger-like uncharacterized protein
VLTRCPACETRFRVTAEQLKARSGRVRCGECQHVFNALDSLIEEPAVVITAPPAGAPDRDSPLSRRDAEAEAATYPDAAADEKPVSPALTVESPRTTPEEGFAPEPDAQQQSIPESTDAAMSAAADPIATTGADIPHWSETFTEPPAPPRRWPWAIGSVLALAVLGLQAMLAFRVELAVLWPEARPTLVTLCDFADCEVGLPAKVALVGIEASDLYPVSGNPGRLALTATLKNRAPFVQQFPHLELTLTDHEDKAIARKVLAPVDYLSPKTISTRGMPANGDILVAIGVDPGEMTASGYRLYLFYP